MPKERNRRDKEKRVALHPIFEALTNSFEAIRERFGYDGCANGSVTLSLVVEKDPLALDPPIYKFKEFVLCDNGVGLTNDGFMRIKTLRDTGKGNKNKGTGRVQFLHSFAETTVKSCYAIEGSTKLGQRTVVLSKGEAFISQNAIVREDADGDAPDGSVLGTEVRFNKPLDPKEVEIFDGLKVDGIKAEVVRHFLAFFCDCRNALPTIKIEKISGGRVLESAQITVADIPVPYKEDAVQVKYCKKDENSRIVDVDRVEEFKLRGFRISADELKKNEILLVSKGETARGIDLTDLRAKDSIDNNRYLFLLSGEYIDAHDADTRGNINLKTEREYKKEPVTLLDEPIILLDRIEDATNAKIRELCVEINSKRQEKDNNVERLRKLFLLNKETVDAVKGKIKNSDSDEAILQTIYEADGRIAAKKDAEIKKQLEDIEILKPEDPDYQEKLLKQAGGLVMQVPLQNRTLLSQYVARRKIVLELFEKILKRELARYRLGERIDEKVLHNLIFRQHSEDPSSSDLWLFNEEFIYFSGASEERLEDITYNGKKIISLELSEEDKRYLNSLGEKRLSQRPDILLFPAEGRCLIIEFKAPDVNVADHLLQVDFYANLLRNYTSDDLKLTRFYGYLIGEGIEDRDVRGRVSDYVRAPGLEYWYRPEKSVTGFNGREDGYIYTEVIKYTTLLQRAIRRNRIFIEKLGLNTDNEMSN